jgi:hypothetical protein
MAALSSVADSEGVPGTMLSVLPVVSSEPELAVLCVVGHKLLVLSVVSQQLKDYKLCAPLE